MGKMRVAIREQLAALVVLAVLVALAILSIPTWIFVNQFVVGVTLKELTLTASLKASRVSAELELVQSSALTIASRLLVQESLTRFYNGNLSDSNWTIAKADLSSALAVSTLSGLLQARVYSRNTTGSSTGLVNVTTMNPPEIRLPYPGQDGGLAFLSDTPDGYPRELYPNLTYVDLNRPNNIRPDVRAFRVDAFPEVNLTANGGLLLGPLVVNASFALISITVPVRENGPGGFILGYMTVVAATNSLIGIQRSREGLGQSGIVLVVGPDNQSNRFNNSNLASTNTFLPNKAAFASVPVQFLFPPTPADGQDDRHSDRTFSIGASDLPFPVSAYPAVFTSFSEQINSINNASAILGTTNEQGASVAVGFARTNTQLANWTVIIEMAQSEATYPITTLRKIILGCVFGTVGLVLVLIFPCAHFSVMPIRRLKAATEKTVHPPGYDESFYDETYDDDPETPGSGAHSQVSKRSGAAGLFGLFKFFRSKPRSRTASDRNRESSRRIFKIPGKVEVRRHVVTDELTELTQTFNDMSDELVKQYTSLDEKVAERTRELELSKKAAEAANESKTLFIANISHELKTPLNGILGMCAVCMEETDILRIKQSLKTLYKSGKILPHEGGKMKRRC
jgi:osomolarity two-component system, sensor histidine kinase SLN1